MLKYQQQQLQMQLQQQLRGKQTSGRKNEKRERERNSEKVAAATTVKYQIVVGREELRQAGQQPADGGVLQGYLNSRRRSMGQRGVCVWGGGNPSRANCCWPCSVFLRPAIFSFLARSKIRENWCCMQHSNKRQQEQQQQQPVDAAKAQNNFFSVFSFLVVSLRTTIFCCCCPRCCCNAHSLVHLNCSILL